MSIYRADIDGLRALAVAGVVLYHLDLGFIPGGYVGVDVFFVISGFLITRIIHDEIVSTGRFDFARFYARRAKRIFPALFATVFFSLLISALVLSPGRMADFGYSAVSALASVSNVYFWSRSGYFDSASDERPLLHTWSLAVEEQFYLLWPLVLWLLLPRVRRSGALGAMLLVAAASLAASVACEDDRSTIFYLLPFRAFELVIGASLALYVGVRIFPGAGGDAARILGLGMIGYAMVGFDHETVFPSLPALVPCLGTALLIAAGPSGGLAPIIGNRAFVWLGKISYSLYLVHWPLIVFYRELSVRPLDMGDRTFLLAASLALAVALHHSVERPLRFGAAAAGWRIPVYSLAAIALLAAPSAHAAMTGGWAWRMAPGIARLADPRNHDLGLGKPGMDCILLPNRPLDGLDPRCY